jgi:hypothetical protein
VGGRLSAPERESLRSRRLAYAWHLEISKSELCPCERNERLRTCHRCALHGGKWGKATRHALGVGLVRGTADGSKGSEDSEYERELHSERGR